MKRDFHKAIQTMNDLQMNDLCLHVSGVYPRLDSRNSRDLHSAVII